MLKQNITYIDFNGIERTEDFYFNLTKAEIQEMELTVTGGYKAMLEAMLAKDDIPGVVKAVKNIILSSYGEKSPDGRRFIKSQELRDGFEQTEAYSQLFMNFIQSAEFAAAFVNGIIPQVPDANGKA